MLKTCPDESTLSLNITNPEGREEAEGLEEYLLPLFLETTQQYGFIGHYLSKVELWQIYERISTEQIPRSQWTILLMQAAYHKMQ